VRRPGRVRRPGFRDASLNRVIEASGISMGSIYDYFDGKEDLSAHVARIESPRSGPSPYRRRPARLTSGRL
jgi:hypothetical protein